MRSPLARAPLICSITLRTASSTSAKARWVWRSASVSISSDLVMARIRQCRCCASDAAGARGLHPARPDRTSFRLVHLLLEQGAKLGRCTTGVLVIRQRFGQLVLVLGADGELQH